MRSSIEIFSEFSPDGGKKKVLMVDRSENKSRALETEGMERRKISSQGVC